MIRSEVSIPADDISLSFPAHDLRIYNAGAEKPEKDDYRRHCQICGKGVYCEDSGQYVYKLYIPHALRDKWVAEGDKKERMAWFCGYKHYMIAYRMIAELREKSEECEEAKERKTKTARCVICGREFTTAASNARYCSPECFRKQKNAKRKERREKNALARCER